VWQTSKERKILKSKNKNNQNCVDYRHLFRLEGESKDTVNNRVKNHCKNQKSKRKSSYCPTNTKETKRKTKPHVLNDASRCGQSAEPPTHNPRKRGPNTPPKAYRFAFDAGANAHSNRSISGRAVSTEEYAEAMVVRSDIISRGEANNGRTVSEATAI
jgi:hypothetical protein